MQVLVRDNNVDEALRVLKKKMQREGVFREMKLRRHYEKPSERKVREKSEAVRRARKLARKKLQREGLLPMKPRVILGAPGRAATPAIHASDLAQSNRFPRKDFSLKDSYTVPSLGVDFGEPKARKINMTSQKDEMPEDAGHETPLIDLSDAAVNQLIRTAKKRGYVTHGQINELLYGEEMKSEQIEDMLAKLDEIGINVVETKEADLEEEVATQENPEEEADSDTELVEVRQRPVSIQSGLEESAERTSDPVGIYLREMGSVELLSREGEIAIAKRIEAGREAMIAGLCESPLTFQAIIIWRDELNAGKILLRDIIDLDATHAGPDAKAISAPAIGPSSQLIAPSRGQFGRLPQTPLPATARATAFLPAENGRMAVRRQATRRSARAISTTRTICRIGSRSPQSRPSSSPR